MIRRTLLAILGCLSLAACASLSPRPAAPPPTSLPPTAAPVTEAAAPTIAPPPGYLPFVDWLAYHDDVGHFTIQHPLTWQQVNNEGDPPTFSLQAAPGTTLLEKYVQIDVTPQAAECRQMRYGGEASASSHVTINGIDFLKETGAGLGAGNVYEWTSYSTQRDGTCISLIFVLHSANPGVYATEPPDFDRAAESEIFDQLINTFQFDQ